MRRSVLSITLCLTLAATAAPANDAVPSAAAGTAPADAPPKVVVLTTGRLIEGPIRNAANGYEVAAAAGVTFLPESQVWFTAAGRREAYEIMRARLPDRADTRVELAQWCMEYQLHDAAWTELHSALKLDPNHREARETLKRLDRIMNPDGAHAAKLSLAERHASRALNEPAALGNLPPEVARAFVTSVQPILVNRCGNAGCHGGGESAFRIRNVRIGSPGYQSLTEQNLDAALAMLLRDRPAASPLLAAPKDPSHGGVRKPIFAGPGGAFQLKSLSAWVAKAAPAMPESKPSTGPDRAITLAASTGGGSVVPAAAETPAASSPEPSDAGPGAAPTPSDETTDLLRRLLAEERPDAFDPAAFNRRFGPRAGRDALSPPLVSPPSPTAGPSQ